MRRRPNRYARTPTDAATARGRLLQVRAGYQPRASGAVATRERGFTDAAAVGALLLERDEAWTMGPRDFNLTVWWQWRANEEVAHPPTA